MSVPAAQPDVMTDDRAERSLLGAILIDGSLLGRLNGLQPEHFGAEHHRVIFAAIAAVAERGLGIDLTTVQSELDKTGRTERAGGAAVLSALVDRVPDVENFKSYERLVLEGFQYRQATATTNEQVRALATGAPLERVARLARAVQSIATPADRTEPTDSRRLIATSTLFDEYLARKTTIVPCALAGLRKLLHGGFETRKNHVFTAPAGGGKTALLVQHAAYAVLHGDLYAVLALKDGDQWSDGLRLAQMAGVDRFKLRDRDPESVDAAREAMARYSERLMFYDVTQPGASFADMGEQGLRWVNGRGQLLIGTDSIHVFPASDQAKERAMPIYDRIAVRLETIHDFVVANDAVGLTVGQSGRASYSRKRDDENVDLLAAISGGHIAENTVDVLIVVTKPNESGTRFLVVPKSRLGGQGSRVPVTFNEERSLWLDAEPVEQAAPKESRAKARRAAKDEDERKATEAIGLLIRRTPEGMTTEEARKASGRGREWVASVIDALFARSQIRREVVQRTDVNGRKLPVSVWKWETGQ